MASVQSMHGQGLSHSSAPAPAPPTSSQGGLASLNGTKRKHDDFSSTSFDGAIKTSPSEDDTLAPQGETPSFSDSDPSVEAFAISETKRRAQNRAAQRAFRERKERHLRELESRLAELETESRSWKSTNMALRSQLSMLEDELQHYRYPQPGDSQGAADQGQNMASQNLLSRNLSSQNLPSQNLPSQNLPSQNLPSQNLPSQNLPSQNLPSQNLPSQNLPSQNLNIQNSNTQNLPSHLLYPFEGSNQRLGQPLNEHSSELDLQDQFNTLPSGQIPATMTPHHQQAQTQTQTQQQQQKGQLSGQIQAGQLPTGLSKSNINGMTSSNTNGQVIQPSLGSPGSLSNPGLAYDSPSSGSSIAIKADDFCDRLSTACGTRDHPVPENAPRISSETPGWQQDALFGNIADWVQNDNWSFREKKHAEPPAQQPTQPPVQHEPRATHSQDAHAELSPLAMNLDFGNIASGFGPLNLNGDGLDFDGLLGNEFGVFDPLDDMLEWQPKPQQEQQPKQPEHPQAQITPAEARDRQSDEVPVASQKFIPCADVWDRICSHPRFGEIDINSMCQELRNKARCSKRGVVLNEQDVDQVLGSLR